MPANLNFKDRIKTAIEKKNGEGGHKVKYKYNLNVNSATYGEMGGGGRQKLSVALYNSMHLVSGWLLVSYLDISKTDNVLKVLQSGAGKDREDQFDRSCERVLHEVMEEGNILYTTIKQSGWGLVTSFIRTAF